MTPPTTQRPAHVMCHTTCRSTTLPPAMSPCSESSTLSKDLALRSGLSAMPAAARLTRKMQSLRQWRESGTRTTHAVFLGGSCNPTTWRHDVAMPMLEAARVSYFNPQVDEWSEERIKIEAQAKETAQLVLMVIDRFTRSIVCIHEAVELICKGRKVVLVVNDIQDGTKVAETVLSTTELADLNGARQCLRALAYKRGVSLLLDVSTAIRHCITWLLQPEAPQLARLDVPRLRKRSTMVFNDWSNSHRLYHDALRSHSFLVGSLDSNPSSTDESEGSDSSATRSMAHQLGCQFFCDDTSSVVYLGGNLTQACWRQEVAIPVLQTAGIPLYVPYADYLQFGLRHVAAKHDIATQKARAGLMLFVIPRNVRAIAAMTEAVELVASHQALLLVIEPVKQGCMVEDGMMILGREFQDLARARAYLRDMAERNQVAVFESVSQAVANIVERLEFMGDP